MNKNIVIFTTFRSADPAYSLNRVVQTQIKMLTRHNYQPKVIVAKGFQPIEEYEKVECLEIPDVPVDNQIKIDETFRKDVETLKEALEPILKEADIIFTHDLVYQAAALKHNVAVRELVAEGKVKAKFIHWIHSAACPAVLQEFKGFTGADYLKIVSQPFPNSFYIVFNTFSIPRLASWFNIEQDIVKYVPHPHDFYEDMDPLSVEIIEKGNLLQKDVVIIYPVRLDRGKQAEYPIKIGAAIKKTGRSVGVVIVDFHSTGGDKVDYRRMLKNLAISLSLSPDECQFASELHGEDKLIASFPHKVVKDLFSISNTFVLSSKSETYSLIAQEAIMARNLCILNHDFPPFRSIYGDEPIYKQFSGNIQWNGMDGETTTNYGNEEEYWLETANNINYAQEHTRVLKTFNRLRKDRNLDNVFKQYLEPLLSEPDGKLNY